MPDAPRLNAIDPFAAATDTLDEPDPARVALRAAGAIVQVAARPAGRPGSSPMVGSPARS